MKFLIPEQETAMKIAISSDERTHLTDFLDVWFSTSYSEDEWNRQQIEQIKQLEAGQT